MDELSYRFNQMIMQEVGLEMGPKNRLYDQDTGDLVKIEGKDLLPPGVQPTKDAQEFDPYNSYRMMTQIFSYYTDKLASTGEAPDFSVFYTIDAGKGKKKLEVRNDDEVITSTAYVRDTCAYADIIMRLNGDDNPDLKEFDIPKAKPSVRKAPSRKKPTDKSKKGDHK